MHPSRTECANVKLLLCFSMHLERLVPFSNRQDPSAAYTEPTTDADVKDQIDKDRRELLQAVNQPLNIVVYDKTTVRLFCTG